MMEALATHHVGIKARAFFIWQDLTDKNNNIKVEMPSKNLYRCHKWIWIKLHAAANDPNSLVCVVRQENSQW